MVASLGCVVLNHDVRSDSTSMVRDLNKKIDYLLIIFFVIKKLASNDIMLSLYLMSLKTYNLWCNQDMTNELTNEFLLG
jgi:hypothetical protein